MGGPLLIIDDDNEARQYLKAVITASRFKSFRLLQSDSADGGLRLAKEYNPSVIFLDPSTGGGSHNLIRHISRIVPHSAAVVVTQLKMFDLVYMAINGGLRGYLLKPVVPVEVMEVLERLIGTSSDSSSNVSVDEAYDPVHQVVNFVEEHFCEQLSLTEVADMVYLSPSYFSRQFKHVMNMTFVEYLTHRRITHAKQLLRLTDLPVDLIAEESGFRRASYFATLFHRVQGQSPSEYRRRFRGVSELSR